MRRTSRWVGAAAAAFVTAVASAQCGYDVEPIYGTPAPPPFDFLNSLNPLGINDNDEIVGWMSTLTTDFAFKWSPLEGLEILDLPIEVSSSRAWDINMHGTIVGDLVLPGIGTVASS